MAKSYVGEWLWHEAIVPSLSSPHSVDTLHKMRSFSPHTGGCIFSLHVDRTYVNHMCGVIPVWFPSLSAFFFFSFILRVWMGLTFTRTRAAKTGSTGRCFTTFRSQSYRADSGTCGCSSGHGVWHTCIMLNNPLKNSYIVHQHGKMGDKQVNVWRERDAIVWRALRSTRKQAELLLLFGFFKKMQRYVQYRQQHAHFKRCAAFLKHHDVKKRATTYFLRWLSIIHRKISIQAGQREPKKFVALPRKQDFFNLSIRYFSKWRTWLRHLRQRTKSNVALLEEKTNEKLSHRAFSQWRNFSQANKQKYLETTIQNLQDHNESLLIEIQQMDKKLQQYEELTAKTNSNAEILQTHANEQKEIIKQLSNAIQTAVYKLEHPITSPPSPMEHHHAVGRVAEEGDELPMRLLSACESAVMAMQKLRTILPEDFRQSDKLEAVADVICEHTRHIQDKLLAAEEEVVTLRALSSNNASLLEELQMHDERWVSTTNTPEGAVMHHFTKRFDGGGWGAVLQQKPAELMRAFLVDAAAACHVDVECVKDVKIIGGDALVVNFKVMHSPSRTRAELARRIDIYPFRMVRRMYELRDAPKDGVDLLEEKLKETQKKVTELRVSMEKAAAALEHPITSPPSPMEHHHAVGRVAEEGDELPLRLLSACESAVMAMQKLRTILPEDFRQSDKLEAVADVICEHTRHVQDKLLAAEEELYDKKCVIGFLRDCLINFSDVLRWADNEIFTSDWVSEEKLLEFLDSMLSYEKLYDSVAAAENSSDGKRFLEVVRCHVEENPEFLVAGPSKVSVVESFLYLLKQVLRRLVLCKSLCEVEQKKTREQGEQRGELSAAVRAALMALQGWSPGAKESWKGISEENDLIEEMLRESEEASGALAQVRSILIKGKLVLPKSVHGGGSEKHDDKTTSVDTPDILTHDDLVKAVQEQAQLVQELSEAYEKVYTELRRFVSDSFSASDSSRRFGHSATQFPSLLLSSVTDVSRDSVKKAELVVQAVRKHIHCKGAEVKELRGAMRRGIVALGGSTDDSETDDDTVEQTRSAAKSAEVGKRLVLLCRDTGDAIEDAKSALGIPKGGRFKLSDVIPDLKEKMQELEVVKTESVALVQMMRSALSNDPDELPSSMLRSMKPKQKPVAISVTEEVAMPSSGKTMNSIPSRDVKMQIKSPHTVKVEDMIKQLRKEVYEKSSEVRDLREACKTIISVLDGSYVAGKDPPQYGDLLVPLLITQAEDLKQVQKELEILFSGDTVCNSSVSNRLSILASQVSSLRISNEAMKEEIMQRTKQNSYLINDFVEEVNQLKEANATLLEELRDVKKREAKHLLRQSHVKSIVESMQLRIINDHRRKRFFLWMVRVVAARGMELREVCNKHKLLSVGMMQKQHQQNMIARMLYTALHALPGWTEQDAEVLAPELMLIRCAHSVEGVTLETLVHQRVDEAKQWMRSVASLHTAVRALRTDADALRRAVMMKWDENLRELQCCLSRGAFLSINNLIEEREVEREFLRKRVLDREAFAQANKELAEHVSYLQMRILDAQECIQSQDAQIIQLQRKNRDLQLERVVSGDDDGKNGNVPGAVVSLRSQVEVERFTIAEARRLSVEAIVAMAGKDVAACLGEVAELTLDLHHRTATALADIVEAQRASGASLAALLALRLKDLQSLDGVRNEIVRRLPVLLQVPYVSPPPYI